MPSAAPTHHNVVACLGGGATALQSRPAPRPGAGEMLLGLRVVGFCGTDLFKLQTDSAPAGTVLGHDDGEPVTTPYDNCVLVMPSINRPLRAGVTVVRLGRLV